MNARLIRHSLSVLAIVALSGSIALTQQTPAAASPTAPPPPDASTNSGMRRPSMRPGMMQGRPGMMQHGMSQRGRGPQMMHSRFHGGPGGGFHGRPQDGGGMGFHIGPEGMWWKNPMVVQRLSLTADQTKKMDDIFQQSRLQLIDLKADVEKAQVMLEPMLSANPLDVARASAQIDKVAQARADLEKANAKMLLGIRGVLTADQWTKLRDRRSGEGPGEPGGAGASGPQGGQAPGGGPGSGRSRGMTRGGQTGSSTNLIDPIDQP